MVAPAAGALATVLPSTAVFSISSLPCSSDPPPVTDSQIQQSSAPTQNCPPNLKSKNLSVSNNSNTSVWSDLFASTSSSQKSFPKPSFLADDPPIVRAPPEILLKSSEMWKGYLLCIFFGTPPSPAKIFNDLNPIWGENGAITIRQFTEGSCLILIPSLPTRQWVCDVGFWSAGRVAFSVIEWKPFAKLHNPFFSSAPLWVTFHDVPPQLWSSEGFQLIASGIGKPLLPKRQDLLPTILGTVRIRVIVDLEKALPSAVIVQDSEGTTARIEAEFGHLPPRCSACSRYGHSAHRCHPHLRRSPLSPTEFSASLSSSAVTEDTTIGVSAGASKDLSPTIFQSKSPPAAQPPTSASVQSEKLHKNPNSFEADFPPLQAQSLKPIFKSQEKSINPKHLLRPHFSVNMDQAQDEAHPTFSSGPVGSILTHSSSSSKLQQPISDLAPAPPSSSAAVRDTLARSCSAPEIEAPPSTVDTHQQLFSEAIFSTNSVPFAGAGDGNFPPASDFFVQPPISSALAESEVPSYSVQMLPQNITDAIISSTSDTVAGVGDGDGTPTIVSHPSVSAVDDIFYILRYSNHFFSN